MDKIVPVYYTEYGRYLSRFRSIPYYVDCLIPVYRRILLSLKEIASTKLQKSAKVVGHVIGNYHPHGSDPAYGGMISLHDQGFCIGQGNFGSPGLRDASPSAQRYTEIKLKPWVIDFAFKYIDYVQWENFEFENEPLFLPCPIPIGLIGDGGVYSGVAFHKCVMPRYKLNDLAKRLKYLLTGADKIIIYPNMKKDGCTIAKDDVEAENILTTGVGKLTIVPDGDVINKKLRVYGRVPLHTFTDMVEDADLNIVDLSGKTLDIQITPAKRVEDLNSFYQSVYSKHLIKSISFIINICDDYNKVVTKGIDELLLTNFEYYKQIVKYERIDSCVKEIEKKHENQIIILIRKVLKDNPGVKSITEILPLIKNKNITINKEHFDFENNKWVSDTIQITDDEIINICSKRTIKSLIEHDININSNDTKINSIKTDINNNDKICFDLICDLCTKTF